jgi:hypothetical protein
VNIMTTQSSSTFQHGEPLVKIVRLSDRQKEIDKLPPPETKRWVMRRKAQVVAAVRSGLLTFEECCQRYRLSEEEFKSWMALLDRHGLRGLRATRVQEYRPAEQRTGEETVVE